jgi:hypothetical protein
MTAPHEKARVIIAMPASMLLTKVQTDPEWAARLLFELAGVILPPVINPPPPPRGDENGIS